MSVLSGPLAGFCGGLLAAGAMSLAHAVISATISEPEPPATQGSSTEEDATVKVASAVASSVGYRLAESEKSKAGTVVHYTFGAGVGAVYGTVAEFVPMVKTGLGLPFGAAVWLGAHVIAVPSLGLAKPPTQRPAGTEAEEFALHLVYGLTTELVRRVLRFV